MKKCPYCAEEIQDEAIKCRFCLEFIPIQEIVYYQEWDALLGEDVDGNVQSVSTYKNGELISYTE